MKKKIFRWKFSNVLLAFVFLNIKSVKIKKKNTFLQMEIFKCTLCKVEVLHNLYRHYMKRGR